MGDNIPSLTLVDAGGDEKRPRQHAAARARDLVASCLVAAAFVNVATGFCIPSFMYGLMFGRPSGCAVQRAARDGGHVRQ